MGFFNYMYDDDRYTVKDIDFVLEKDKYEKFVDTINEKENKHMPLFTFHSSQNPDKLASISKYGYLLPGETHPTQGWTLGMRTGNVYGDGIYSAFEFTTSKWYSFIDLHRGVQVIINAVCLGNIKYLGTDDTKSKKYNYDTRYDGVPELDIGATSYRTGHHTLISNENGIVVSCNGKYIVPIAIVTLEPNTGSDKLSGLIRISEHSFYDINKRLKYSENKEPVKFHQLFGKYYVIRHNYVDRLIKKQLTLIGSKFSKLKDTIGTKYTDFTVKVIDKILDGLTEVLKSLKLLQKESSVDVDQVIEDITDYMNGFERVVCKSEELDKQIFKKYKQLEKQLGLIIDGLNKFVEEYVSKEVDAKTLRKVCTETKIKHTFVFPISLCNNLSTVKDFSHFVNSLPQSDQKYVALYNNNCTFTKITTLGQVEYLCSVMSKSLKDKEENLANAIDTVFDKITNDDSKAINVCYFFCNKANKNSISDAVEKYSKYLPHFKTVFKIIFMNNVKTYDRYHPIKNAQTIQIYESWFHDVTQSSLSDVFDAILDENNNIIRNVTNEKTFHVPFPYGIIGEGFMTDLTQVPSWDAHLNQYQNVLYEGQYIKGILHSNKSLSLDIHEDCNLRPTEFLPFSAESIDIGCDVLLQLLSKFRNYIIKSSSQKIYIKVYKFSLHWENLVSFFPVWTMHNYTGGSSELPSFFLHIIFIFFGLYIPFSFISSISTPILFIYFLPIFIAPFMSAFIKFLVDDEYNPLLILSPIYFSCFPISSNPNASHFDVYASSVILKSFPSLFSLNFSLFISFMNGIP